MQLIFLHTLKSISGYTSLRGVRSWLLDFNVPLLRVGKNYAVSKSLFEQRFQKKHGLPRRETYVPIQKSEKAFLNEVSRLLSNTPEL